jgi:uncharacterized protein (DUF302 family)
MSDNGLITIPSAYGVEETIERLSSEVKSKGMTIFARVDHAAGAKDAGYLCGRRCSLSSGMPKAVRR